MRAVGRIAKTVRRVAFALTTAIVVGLLLIVLWKGPLFLLFASTITLGLSATMVFSVLEGWPQRLPRWIQRWVLQVVAGGVAGAGVTGSGVVAGAAGGSVVVAGAMASCGAVPPNHPLVQPMIASTMTTTTTPMIVFFLSIMTSLALNCGHLDVLRGRSPK